MKKPYEITATSYVIGFGLSCLLTLCAYFFTINRIFSGDALIVAIAIFAFAQLFVQLTCFLHLGTESKPRINLLAFLFMTVIVVVLVAGTLWIMRHLDYHALPPSETDTYLLQNEGFKP